MFKHKRRRPHPRPLPAASLLPSLIMKRSFPGNKTPWAVEVEEFPPHPAVIAVHLQRCKCCPRERRMMRAIFLFLLCGIRSFRGSSAKRRPRGRIGVSASLDLCQFRFRWLISSFSWKCYPCRELGIGGPGPLAMESLVWLSQSMLATFVPQNKFSSAQLHPKIFPSKQNPSVLGNQADLVNSVTSNALQ